MSASTTSSRNVRRSSDAFDSAHVCPDESLKLEPLLNRVWPDVGVGKRATAKTLGTWHRPFSLVQHLEIKSATGIRSVVLKQNRACEENHFFHLRGDASQAEFESQQRAWNHFQRQADLGVAQPLAIDEKTGCLLMDYVEGKSLENDLTSLRYGFSTKRLAKSARRFELLGRWLRHYQANPSAIAEGKHVDSAKAIERLWGLTEPRLQAVMRAGDPRIPNRFVEQIQLAWNRKREFVGDVRLVPCHGDFGPWNVLVETSGEICVLDFFCARLDFAELDVLNVLTYLDVQAASLLFSTRRVAQLKSAFLKGYGEFDPASTIAELCRMHQKICRLQDAVLNPAKNFRQRRQREIVVKTIVESLRSLNGK